MENKLTGATQLAKKIGHIFLATADMDCVPHVAAAGRLEYAEQDCVMVSEWFCPGTVKNLQINHAVSIVIWDQNSDTGFQLVGHLRSVRNIGVLDGFGAGVEQQYPLPQEEKELRIQIENVLDFRRGPHSDTNVNTENMPLFAGGG